MLNPVMPDEVAVEPIPRQHLKSLLGIFSFSNVSGYRCGTMMIERLVLSNIFVRGDLRRDDYYYGTASILLSVVFIRI